MNRLPLPIVLLALLALACEPIEEPATPAATETPPPTETAIPSPAFPATPPPAAEVAADGTYLIELATGELLPVAGLTWSPDGRHVAGVHCCTGEGGLDIYDLDTGLTKQIYEGDVGNLAWSPDGQRIAFSRFGTTSDGLIGPASLMVVNGDGSGLKTLSKAHDAAALSWSPDERYIALTDHQSVYLWEASTGETSSLTRKLDRATWISALLWSPDSAHLAFQGDYRPAGWLQYIYTVASGELVSVGSGWNGDLAWSPNGGRLAVADETGLSLIDPLTGSRRRLASGASGGPLSWSPDGSIVAFTFGEALPFIGYDGQISRQIHYLVAADGSGEPRALPPSRGLSWSPDGKRLVYSSEGCITGDWDLYMADADTRTVTRLTDSPDRFKEGPAWSPDGAHVFYSSIDALVAVDTTSKRARTLVRYTHEDSHIHLSADPASPDGRYVGFGVSGGHGVCD